MKNIFVDNKTFMRIKFVNYSPYFAIGGTFTADGMKYLVKDITVDLFNKWTRIYFESVE